MHFERTKSECSKCPLRDRNRVWGKGKPGGIVFIGEAPGQKEDTLKEPFVGPAGKYLNWAFKALEIPRWNHWVTNITPCRYPSNDWDDLDSDEARIRCQSGLRQELEWLRSEGSTVIVALGKHVATHLGIEGSIGKIRGSIYQAQGFYVIPTYHPSYFQRMTHRKQDGSLVTNRLAWLNDLKKAKRIARKGWNPPEENFELNPDVERIEQYAKNVIANKALIAVDIETTGLDPLRSEIVVVGLADTSEHGVSIPFLRQGGHYTFTNGERKRVRKAVSDVFQSCPLVFQNSLFDVPFLRAQHFDIDFKNIRHDTLLLHHAIAPEQPHNLGYIVSIYGETPYWKEPFQDRDGGILDLPNDTLRTYNLRDCVVLHQVLEGMLADLEKRGLVAIYGSEVIPLLRPIGQMMEAGIKLDKSRLRKLKQTYEAERARLEKELKADMNLPNVFNFDAPDDMRWFFYGSPPSKFNKLAELSEYDESTMSDDRKKPLKKDTKKYQQLLEVKDLLENTPKLPLPSDFIPRKTDSGKDGTGKQVVLSMLLSINNRLKRMEKFKTNQEKHEQEKVDLQRTITWLEKFQEYKELSKIISTYLDFPVKQDGRVHTQFLIHGTDTGRLSSRNPNLQNLPKKRIDLRKPFVAEEGNLFVSADYSNLEIRILAEVTQDQPLLEAFANGDNIHDLNTRDLFGLTPDDDLWKLARRAAKIFFFGGISYGGSDREIYEKVLLEAPGLGLTFQDFVQARKRWMAAHPAYAAWSNMVVSEALRTGQSRIFNGRVRGLYGSDNDIRKQALNTPIQGGAAVVINRASIRVHERLLSECPDVKLILQIHDQLVAEAPKDMVAQTISILKIEMEKPVEVYPAKPAVFPVDVEIGESLGELHEYESP